MADGLRIRINATNEVITKSQSQARALIERNKAELVGESDSDGVKVRLPSGEIAAKSRNVALALLARGEASEV
jgi:hypothetical protein